MRNGVARSIAAVIPEIFGALETLRQALANCLLDHPRAGKTNHRAGLGDMHIAQHCVGRGHAARGRVGQDDDVGKPRRPQTSHRDRCADHLRQSEHAFLHARAT